MPTTSLHRHPLAIGLLLLGGCILITILLGAGRTALSQDAPATMEQPAIDQAAPVVDHAQPAAAEGAHGEAGEHKKVSPHPAWMIPFVALLACIALMPLFISHFWHHHYPKIAAGFFLVGLCYYLLVQQNMHHWFKEMKEYVSFIALLFALFVISGGIVINVSRKATPLANCTLLLLGAVIANIFGTTGAAMLLIRPYIRINRGHIKPYHIVFFIFLVANVGGCLTPIGDPPLFLGYLKGVPFWWVIEHCWQPWAVAVLILLVIFFVMDKMDHAKEERFEPEGHDTGPGVRINGIHNFLFILIVLVAVFRPSVFETWSTMTAAFTGSALINFLFSREIIMVAAGIVSKLVTYKGVYERNEFSWEPIREVAILFVAIFSCMVPALQWLDANAEKMPTKTPGQFYFVTGALSSVLDNAPTYLTFLQTKLGDVEAKCGPEIKQVQAALAKMQETRSLAIDPALSPDVQDVMATLVQHHGKQIIAGHVPYDEIRIAFLITMPSMLANLIAISVGAVFFGAMTYIGNAPNFMVKSIAESSGIKMPSFLGYVFRYSLPILLPVLVIVWVIFFLFGFGAG